MHKIDNLIKNKRIKTHLFLPSKRRIFTIVSNEEHWLDLDVNFCSCKGYYYTYSRRNDICYHLQALAKSNECDVIIFDDEEYDKFLHALICDLSRYTK